MRRLIPQVGNVALSQRGDAFTTLARSIVGQQVSVASAQRVWDQFDALSRSMTPRSVLKLKVDDMRAAGLSARKVEYLVDLALHFDNGQLHVKQWDQMDDPGLISGISQNYFSGDPVSRSDAREVAEAWKPWCSVATWYIWRSLDPLPVTY